VNRQILQTAQIGAVSGSRKSLATWTGGLALGFGLDDPSICAKFHPGNLETRTLAPGAHDFCVFIPINIGSAGYRERGVAETRRQRWRRRALRLR